MGTTINCPEIREVSLSPQERAEARDSFVRNFDRQFRDWQGIAKCCIDVRQDEDWKTLGHHSFSAWLEDAAPASKRYLRLVIGMYEDLAVDIPEERLQKIPLGTGAILHRQVKSKKMRQDPRVLEAAEQKPKQFTETMQKIAPEQHIEGIIRQSIDFTASQWGVVEATFEKYQVMFDSGASLASFIEWMCSEISEWTLHADKDNEGRANDPEREVVH